MTIYHQTLATSTTFQFIGAGTNYIVRDNSGNLYLIYIDVNLDVVYKKATDGGITWGSPVTVFTGSATQLSVWFDRWSNISAGLIHCAYSESANDDTLYRTIDTESSDALSTETTIFAGLTTANGGALSICRARGGNVYCKTMIDAGAEGGFFRLLNANVPNGAWASRTDSEALATTDQWILVPGWAADNQDMMMFFWDASVDEISRCLYDDSADTWAETSIATTMVDTVATSNFPHFSAAVDITNSRNLLAAWTATDLLNADLRFWHVTESTITEVTNVVANSTDDQGFTAVGIDTATQDWYVFYGGVTAGTDTFTTNLSVNYKVSTDDGSSWGAETTFSLASGNTVWLVTAPRFVTDKKVSYVTGTAAGICTIVDATVTAAVGGQLIYGG